jgi:hypothetical protein
MRSDLVIVCHPGGNGLPGLRQEFKPVLIRKLIAKDSAETVDFGILHWAARLYQDVFEVVLLPQGINALQMNSGLLSVLTV